MTDENQNFLGVNPVVVGIEFLIRMLQMYPEHSKHLEEANKMEVLCTTEVYRKFVNIENKYDFAEDEIVDDDCDAIEGDEMSEWIDKDGNVLENELKNPNYISLDEKKRMLEIVSRNPRKKFKWIQEHGCSKMLYPYYKKMWEDQVKSGGTKFEKFKSIDDFVWNKFQEARKELRTVHGHDIQRWGLEKAKSFPECSNFVFRASKSWVAVLKKRHRITSRKICKLVNKRDSIDFEQVQKRAEAYIQQMKEAIVGNNHDNVLNWDQTGCNYEMVSPRTLTFRGEAVTYGYARSPTNRMTHSYTVQHTISLSGRVIGPAYVCLQEQTGRLGPRVEKELFTAQNVLLTCSKSGKLTTSLHEYYLDNGLVPFVINDGSKFLLSFDHWNGQVDKSLYDTRFGVDGVPSCEIIMVPERCTPFCQPLDTVYNRQYKYLLKRITGHIQLEHEDTDKDPVYSRNNILKLQSLLHYQLSAVIFSPMIRYAWYKSGIVENKEPFFNVKEVCFTLKNKNCKDHKCTNSVFIQCSICRAYLCFYHFFHMYHIPSENCVEVHSRSDFGDY